MNLRQLAYFKKVVEIGNMTAAAEQLNLAQPALGAQIRQLESELGVELFIRHSRGMTATKAGDLLYQHAQKILNAVDQASYEVRKLNGKQHAQIKLGISPGVVRGIGPELLIDFQKRIKADLSLIIREERTHALLDAITQDQIDLAFINNAVPMMGLERRALVEEDLLLVTAPQNTPDDAGDNISFAQALTYPLAIAGRRGILRRIVDTEAERLSLSVNVAYEAYSVAAVKALVRSGDAASIVPYNLVADDIKAGLMCARQIVRPTLTRTIFLVRRENFNMSAYSGLNQHIESIIDVYLTAVEPWARRI